MFRKYLFFALLWTLLWTMTPAAANAWTLSSRVMTAGGTLQVGNGALQTPANGTITKSYSADVPVTITASPGYDIAAVSINGTPITPPPSSTTMGLGQYPTKSSQTISASFAKQLVSVTGTAVGSGTVSPSGLLTLQTTTRATYTFSPGIGQPLVSVTGLPADAALTYASTGATATLPSNVTVKATFTVPATPVTIVASFASVIANAAGTVTALTNSTVSLKGSATVYDGSDPAAITYNWSQITGPAVSLSSATTATPSFVATTTGTYQFKLEVTSGSGAKGTATATVTVAGSAAEAAQSQCQTCHNSANIAPAAYTEWAASKHQTTVVMCYNCHTGTHPDRVANRCATCHNSAAIHGAADLSCTNCHNSHSLAATATAFDHAALNPAQFYCGSCHGAIGAAFATSQHGTRQGKATWYTDHLNDPNASELQKGFGNYVQIAYAALPCGKCHNAAAWTPAGGTDQWVALTGGNSVCVDCHGNRSANASTTALTAPVTKSTCFGCHSRQANEASAGLTDVHFVAGMGCTACHSTADLHGTGTQSASQLAWGTISAQCENCHGEGKSRGPLSTIAAHVQHAGNIACSTCHAESMITCHNCHFDNEAGAGGALKAKFFSGKMGGTAASGNSWRFLVNRVMPDGSTKIYPGSMQSLVADHTVDGVNDGKGHTHAGIAPYYSHTITRVNALTCDKCHGTETVVKLAAGQPVRVTTWNAAAGVAVSAANVTSTFTGPKGVIPVPENPRGKLLMDFVDLTNPELGTASNRVLFQKDGPDTIHMPEGYVKPLTAAQMQKLASVQLDHTSPVVTASVSQQGYSANTCQGCHQTTNASFATSLHGTRSGKETFFNHNLGNGAAEPLQKGFGNYVNVSYTALPCADCHNPAAWTPTGGSDTWAAETSATPVCTDCHSNKVNGVATTTFDAPVAKGTCIGCHSRQANESSMGLTDVHTSGAVINGQTMNFSCSSCHSLTDMHGDGTAKASILDPGAITAKCENCHTAMAGSTTPEHTVHLANIACSTCHMESVITCYGCHFDNEASDPADSTILHAKFASGKFGGTAASGNSWRFLVNRVMPDGSTKIYPASMQSLVADRTAANAPGEDNAGWTHAAIAPYYSHSITRTNALKCDKCHGIQKAIDLRDGVPVRVVKWGAAAGVQVPVGSMMATYTTKPSGVIPVPENPVGKLLMDFVDLANPAAGPLNAGGTSPSPRVLFKADGPDSIHMPNSYVKPLTSQQINALATPQVRPQ